MDPWESISISNITRFCVLVLSACLCSCEVGSSDSVTRNVGLDVSGFYQHPNHPAQKLVAENTGLAVTSLSLNQTGDQLEARDNNGSSFSGTIGEASDSSASFTLEGQTTAGQSATISGTITVDGGNATMRGTWIEPSLYSTVYGVGTVPTNASPVEEFRVEPSSATISTNSSIDLTIIGGQPGGDVSWSNHSIGSLTEISDNVVRYTAFGMPGTNTITATAADGRTSTATIVQH